MTPLLSTYFELLKATVLQVAGFKTVTPADCKIIVSLIQIETKQHISETTMKRVLGFASSTFSPSLYTIDAMCKYCGYDGWEDFCKKNKHHSARGTPSHITWQLLKSKADKLSFYTLQALKNRSGVPFGRTIKRDFMEFHMAEFENCGCIATVFPHPRDMANRLPYAIGLIRKLRQTLPTRGRTSSFFLAFIRYFRHYIAGKQYLIGYQLFLALTTM